jgi:hypothetical protein
MRRINIIKSIKQELEKIKESIVTINYCLGGIFVEDYLRCECGSEFFRITKSGHIKCGECETKYYVTQLQELYDKRQDDIADRERMHD